MRKACFGYKKSDVDGKIGEMQEIIRMYESQIAVYEDHLAKMKEAAKILRDDAVIVPLIAKKGVGLFDPELKGFLEPRVLVAIELSKLHW